MKKTLEFDLIILGGGIAGMTAAIFSARSNLKTVILEKQACGGLANWTSKVENFPSHMAISGMELMDKVLAQVKKLGVTVDESFEINSLSIDGPVKSVVTEEAVYIGKAIILATGREPIRLPINTDCEFIHYCSVCDGNAYAGKKVMVVGGGNSGFDESLYLLSLGVKEIILVEAMEECCAAECLQDKLCCHESVSIKKSTAVIAIMQKEKKVCVTLKDLCDNKEEEILVDGVFVFIGQKPGTKSFQGMVALDDYGYILANSSRETNLPGVFAAGDVVQKEYRYLTTAMADGTIAALAAEKYINSINPSS